MGVLFNSYSQTPSDIGTINLININIYFLYYRHLICHINMSMRILCLFYSILSITHRCNIFNIRGPMKGVAGALIHRFPGGIYMVMGCHQGAHSHLIIPTKPVRR